MEKEERNEAVAMVQSLECLLSIHKAMCSISRTAQPGVVKHILALRRPR